MKNFLGLWDMAEDLEIGQEIKYDNKRTNRKIRRIKIKIWSRYRGEKT